MPPSLKIGCAVITHRAKHHLPHCLPPLLNASVKPRVVVVNSSSEDGTLELAQEMGAETLSISRREFNHGTTREMARQYLKTDIVVMITPDAYLENEFTLEKLIQPILAGKASASYARQIPHLGADFFESFPRAFNYPPKSHIRSLKDVSKYGVYTFFCSNSCSAYSNQALDEIHGFSSVLLGEDTVAVAKMLRKGHAIAYVAEAIARHSHSYSLAEEFCRNFDIGLARKSCEKLLECDSKDSKRGYEYAVSMTKKLFKESPSRLPYAFAHLTAKWLGYQIGKRGLKAPIWLKRGLSTQDFYWK